MKLIKQLVFIFIILLFGIYFGFDEFVETTSLATIEYTEQAAFDSGNITVLFCPKTNCTQAFLDITQDKEIKCAMYDLDEPLIKERISESPFPLIIDDETHIEGLTNTIEDTSSGLMHNKFCIIDEEIVWTGSMNPTTRGTSLNNNNVIIIHSKEVASSYLDEYEEMRNEVFHKGEPISTPQVKLEKSNLLIAFCPEDNCQEKTLTELKSAQKSIHFMTFSFTDYAIGEVLVEKAKSIPVEGVMEKSQAMGTYSVLPLLQNTSVVTLLDEHKATMHHKVFIIDNETVITGSYNPTKSGNERNDENLLIIKNKDIANQFLQEFGAVRNQ